MATVTLDTLIDRVRLASDNEGTDQRHTDDQITTYINVGLASLHRLLVNRYDDYLITSSIFPVTGGTFAMTDDMTKLLGVERQLDSTRYQTLRPIPRLERNQGNGHLYTAFYGQTYGFFRDGQTIEFKPDGVAPGNVRLTWVFAAPTLVSGSANTLGFPYTINGFDEFIVLDAALKLLGRDGETEDYQTIKGRQLEMIADIKASASPRDATGLERVAHVSDDADWSW